MHSLTSLHVSLLHATKPSTFGLLSYVTLLTVRRSSGTDGSSGEDSADGSLHTRVPGIKLKETTSNGVYLYYVQIISTTGTAIEPHH